MRPRTFSLNLFSSLLCVFMVVASVGCDGCNKKLPALQVDSKDMNQNESNWMTVLDDMPKSAIASDELNYMQVLEDLPGSVTRFQQLEHFIHEDSVFWKIWSEIMDFGLADDTASLVQLESFLTQYDEVLQSVRLHSGSDVHLSQQSERLQLAFARMNQLNPPKRIPTLYWAPYWFSLGQEALQGTYSSEEMTVVGLNFFLGDTAIYNRMPPNMFPAYQIKGMIPQRMATQAFSTWLNDVHFKREFYGKKPGEMKVVDLWFAWAKSMHCAARCLHQSETSFHSYEELDDTFFAEMMNWTVDEWNWAIDNEDKIWGEMQQEQRLFSTNQGDINAWFQPGPFTRIGNIPQESPDRLGIFLAWRAVQQAIASSENPEAFEQLLLMSQDYEDLLRALNP